MSIINIDEIPEEILELAAKAATRCLVQSGITGIYNEPDVLREQMKLIQSHEQTHGKNNPAWYCKKNISL